MSLSTLSKGAPLSNKVFVASRLPHLAVTCNGVCPYVLVTFTDVSLTRKILIIITLPEKAKKERAVFLLTSQIIMSYFCQEMK